MNRSSFFANHVWFYFEHISWGSDYVLQACNTTDLGMFCVKEGFFGSLLI